jgi:acyl-CoA dehydrogenase
MSYGAIAREAAALVERTGLLGDGSVWAGQRTVARFFIRGFGDHEQRARWLGALASVAISEPAVGAHPKLLTTRAERDGDGYRIFGEKAWVSNGPLAAVFIVFAVTSVEQGRKRYSAFLVPRETPGLLVDEQPHSSLLAPARHCGLKLQGCRVLRSAMLGAPGIAYVAMARPFRDVEDAVGSFGLLGAFRFLLSRIATRPIDDAAKLSLGGLVALTAVFAEAAEAVVTALDAGELAGRSAALVGLRLLAGEVLHRARTHRDAFFPAEPAFERVFGDIETSLSIARSARMARQARLGEELATGAAYR